MTQITIEQVREAHTPGPWHFVPESGKPGSDENAMGGFRSITDWVCDFGRGTNYYPQEGTPPNLADARLMAASPDMLAALLSVLDAVQCGDLYIECPAGDGAVEAVEAAIKKATMP